MPKKKEEPLSDLPVEWIDELPIQFRPSPFDAIAQRVFTTGKIAKIRSKENSVYTLANRLRHRFKVQELTVEVTGRATHDGWFIFIYLDNERKRNHA